MLSEKRDPIQRKKLSLKGEAAAREVNLLKKVSLLYVGYGGWGGGLTLSSAC